MYLPIGLFGVSIATAALPTVSALAARGDRDGMRRTIAAGLRLMLALNVPATVGLIALATPIVALIFERGSFTAADTPATAAALVFYAPGLLGYSAVKLASPTFYALQDSRTPVAVSILSVGVNVVLNLTLVRVLGYRGWRSARRFRRSSTPGCCSGCSADASADSRSGRSAWRS